MYDHIKKIKEDAIKDGYDEKEIKDENSLQQTTTWGFTEILEEVFQWFGASSVRDIDIKYGTWTATGFDKNPGLDILVESELPHGGYNYIAESGSVDDSPEGPNCSSSSSSSIGAENLNIFIGGYS
jgi:hypothetical protein